MIYEEALIGVWEGDQATKLVGTEDPLDQYNYLEITNTEFILGSYSISIQRDGTEAKQIISEGQEHMNYKWLSATQILIDNHVYDIELSRKEMTLKNQRIELHFNKHRNKEQAKNR
ncbi:hypothetical protein [Paenibacillus sp. 1001270B_150601_E10]|uniref:hypothetical protein n=1 Tax=Paenibacillus sp. 1001270B_150601_E10 TaxID=2787079 RepID=UPI00189E68F9|nr:hypothetical protein [Paenibacillus sp. 1001270B_150601_E10]